MMWATVNHEKPARQLIGCVWRQIKLLFSLSGQHSLPYSSLSAESDKEVSCSQSSQQECPTTWVKQNSFCIEERGRVVVPAGEGGDNTEEALASWCDKVIRHPTNARITFTYSSSATSGSWAIILHISSTTTVLCVANSKLGVRLVTQPICSLGNWSKQCSCTEVFQWNCLTQRVLS